MTPHPMQPPTPQHPAEPFVLPHKVDKFRLLRPLGRGGMGQVYLAYDEMLERQVALKFVASIRPGLEQRERFLIEARAIARIHHPNVVTIYSVGEYDGIPYLVSEYVDGCSLAQVGKPLPSPKVLRIAIELARGLDAAHQRGVLHRDVKPGNILLSKTDEVKLVDFGLAKLRHDNFGNAADTPFPGPVVVHRSPPSADLAQTISLVEKVAERSRNWIPQHIPGLSAITHPGARMGTPLYMAPELWRGEQGTARSDIYSLGAVLYELAYGRPPHEAPSAAQLECLVLDTDAVPLLHRAPSLDPQLAQIIDSCLRRSPAERPSSAQELCAQLETLGMPDEVSSVPDGNPYRGLRPFEPTDRGLLFGRRQDVASVVDQLRMQPFVLITGDSGVGKSSLCRAGVLPSIRDGVLNEERNWSILSMIPGRWPLHAMADALGPLLRIPHGELVTALANEPAKLTIELSRKLGTHYGLLLFIDQLEEVVTQSSPADARILGEFLSHLTQRLPGVRVLAAVRGDFLTRVAERTHLSYELSHAVYLLRPLTTPDLREVIEGPARIKGVRFENEAMIESMVRSTESAEGGLPLLQFTLAQLWEKRDVPRGIILESSLKEMGGVEGSLSSYTESVLSRMLPEQVEAARRILIRLVRSDGTRICRSEEELVAGDPAGPIALDVLVQSRLLVAKRQSASTNTYELAHEALLSGWSQLRDWLSHDREQRAVCERAEAASQEWERFGCRNDLLWREPQILEFDRIGVDASIPKIRVFLDASRDSYRQQTLRNRVYRIIAALISIFVVVAITKLWQQNSERLKMVRDEIIRKAGQPGREIEALAEAIQSTQHGFWTNETAAEQEEALRTVMSSPGRAFPGIQHDSSINWIEYSGNGRYLLTIGSEHKIRIFNAWNGTLEYELHEDGNPISLARISYDGKIVISGSTNGVINVWDVSRNMKISSMLEHHSSVNYLQLSDNGQIAISLDVSGICIIWIVGKATPLFRIQTEKRITAAVLSRNSEFIGIGTDDGLVQIWSVKTSTLLFSDRIHKARVGVLNFSLNNTYLASGSDDSTVVIWDLDNRKMHRHLIDHYSPVRSAQFSPDSLRLVTSAENDVSARLWDVQSGTRLVRLEGHVSPLRWSAYSPDGQRIVTMGMDHTVRLWHGMYGWLLQSYRGHHSIVNLGQFSPDTQQIATVDSDGLVQVWRERLGRSKLIQNHHGAIWAGDISPQGTLVATGGADHLVYISDLRTGTLRHVLAGHEDAILTLAFSPNGRWLVTGGFGSRANLILWDMTNVQQYHVLVAHNERVQHVSFSADSLSMISTAWDNKAIIWDVQTAGLRHILHGHTQPVMHGAISSNGSIAMTASKDHEAILWDTASGSLLQRLRGHKKGVSYIAESPKHSLIVTTSEDGTAMLWDQTTGNSKMLGGHSDWVTFADFSFDGEMLLTAGTDGQCIVWDVGTGSQLYNLIGHGEGIWRARFSPDGQRIVTASNDQSARLWNARTGQPLGIIEKHQGAVMDAKFSPDGGQILTISTDRRAIINDAKMADWRRDACDRLHLWPQYANVWVSTCSKK